MSECIRPRRICALLAAYVVALQAVLLPFSLAVGALHSIIVFAVPQHPTVRRALEALTGHTCAPPAVALPVVRRRSISLRISSLSWREKLAHLRLVRHSCGRFTRHPGARRSRARHRSDQTDPLPNRHQFMRRAGKHARVSHQEQIT